MRLGRPACPDCILARAETDLEFMILRIRGDDGGVAVSELDECAAIASPDAVVAVSELDLVVARVAPDDIVAVEGFERVIAGAA